MKERILSIILAVAMVFSICTGVSAERMTMQEYYPGDIIFEDDFEGWGTDLEMTFTGADNNEYGIVLDPQDPTNYVYNIKDTTWGMFTSNAFITGLDPDEEYTMKVDVLGDIGWIGLTGDSHWTASYFIAGCNDGYTDDYVIQASLSQLQTWHTAVFKFTGLSQVKFTGQVMATHGYMGGNIYIDNLAVYEGDLVDELATPEPMPIPTVEPSLPPVEPSFGTDPESPHDYPNNCDHTWIVSQPGVTGIALYFSPDTYVEWDYDHIYIYSKYDDLLGSYTGNELAGERLCINGDGVKIRLTSDDSVTEYGFKVTGLDFFYNGETPYWWEPLNGWATPVVATPRPTKSPRPSSPASPTPTPTTTASPSPSALASGEFEYRIKQDNTVEITYYRGVNTIADVPAVINGLAVTSIGDRAFANNNIIQKVVFPETVTQIGKNAFDSCGVLNSLDFKESLTSIGDYAFYNCKSLLSVSVPKNVSHIGAYALGYDNTNKVIPGFALTGYKGSAAELYAGNNKLDFVAASSKDAAKGKVTIKFTKKSVKIKRGKKVTLKVRLGNAKKAKFSVDKKGKKVVKLMKKKAKSVVVKGKKKGKATITAKAAGKKATCKVKVK